MPGKTYAKETRSLARKMRAARKTYREISAETGVPKSTLSTWLHVDFPFEMNPENQKIHLARIRKLAVSAIKSRVSIEKEKLQKKIKAEIADYPYANIGFSKSILACLYWAEGTKTEKSSELKFANTDPELMLYFLSLLRKCFSIQESRFKVYLQVHYYHEITATKKFWSTHLGIPLNQFGKVYIKPRSKKKRFRKNSMGICYLTYGDVRLRREILEIAHQLPSLLK